MFDDSWSSYLNDFVNDITSVSGLVKDFFTYLFTNIPELEKLFLISTGVCFLGVGLYFFNRLLRE